MRNLHSKSSKRKASDCNFAGGNRKGENIMPRNQLSGGEKGPKSLSACRRWGKMCEKGEGIAAASPGRGCSLPSEKKRNRASDQKKGRSYHASHSHPRVRGAGKEGSNTAFLKKNP